MPPLTHSRVQTPRCSRMISKAHILAEIRRTAGANGGVPLGRQGFSTETGIKKSDWLGKYWARWSDAVKEAGLQPNNPDIARSADDMLGRLAELAREVGHFPVDAEIKLKRRSDPEFPGHTTLRRLGGRNELIARLREFCVARGLHDVAAFCVEPAGAPLNETEATAQVELGFVYLLKSGRFYKIGRSNAAGRRERELAIQLPEKAKIVHSIKTDDPLGIEAYWHSRFGNRRKNGEWFDLTVADVSAFRRRKFM